MFQEGIKSFVTAPFAGASVTNPLPFTSGVNSETDDQLRVRIKSIGLNWFRYNYGSKECCDWSQGLR